MSVTDNLLSFDERLVAGRLLRDPENICGAVWTLSPNAISDRVTRRVVIESQRRRRAGEALGLVAIAGDLATINVEVLVDLASADLGIYGDLTDAVRRLRDAHEQRERALALQRALWVAGSGEWTDAEHELLNERLKPPTDADSTPDSDLIPLPIFLKDVPEARSWFVDDLIAEGSSVLVCGAPKVGKSLIALHLAAALVGTSGIALGAKVGRSRRVLLIDVDQSPAESRERLRRVSETIGAEASARITVWGAATFDLSNAALANRIESWARRAATEEGAAPFMILDTLRAALPAEADENDSAFGEALRRFLRPLTALGCAVVVLHHANKKSDGPVRGVADRARGSSAIAAGVDSIWLVEEGEGRTLRLRISRRSGPPKDLRVSVDFSTLAVRVVDEAAAVEDDRRRKVVDCLPDEGTQAEAPCTSDVVTETGIPRSTVERHLAELADQGRVRRLPGNNTKSNPTRWVRVVDGREGEAERVRVSTTSPRPTPGGAIGQVVDTPAHKPRSSTASRRHPPGNGADAVPPSEGNGTAGNAGSGAFEEWVG